MNLLCLAMLRMLRKDFETTLHLRRRPPEIIIVTQIGPKKNLSPSGTATLGLVATFRQELAKLTPRVSCTPLDYG
jgi:hypothetical protein